MVISCFLILVVMVVLEVGVNFWFIGATGILAGTVLGNTKRNNKTQRFIQVPTPKSLFRIREVYFELSL